MTSDEIAGTDWTASEIDLVVADYFEMLAMELAQEPFVKSHRNEALQSLTGRSRGSIEFKHQNISAVLLELGMPRISGYKPMANYQGALLDAIERILPQASAALASSDVNPPFGLQDNEELYYGEPPKLAVPAETRNEALVKLIRKYDPATRDERNRVLGKRGEERVYNSECSRLARIDPALSKKVRWVSQIEGDGAGFDILSFEPDGREKLIEVKTTIGGQTTPFFISSNELRVSEKRPNEFRLVRLYDFRHSPKVFELRPPLQQSLIIRPANYRAAFE